MAKGISSKLKKIKMLITDVDGVLTDGRLWLTNDLKWRRFFHVRDGVGMKLFMEAGLELGVISGGKSDDVLHRFEFLKIKHLYFEAQDKVEPFEKILRETGYKESEIAFIGDEVYDIPILKRVGVAVTVPEAVKSVKKASQIVTKTRGGWGAVRELIDMILEHQ